MFPLQFFVPLIQRQMLAARRQEPSTEMPREVYDLMELYPQTSQRRPGVEFIPVPYPPRAPAKERPEA